MPVEIAMLAEPLCKLLTRKMVFVTHFHRMLTVVRVLLGIIRLLLMALNGTLYEGILVMLFGNAAGVTDTLFRGRDSEDRA
jgi:hypothetical protein